MDSDATAQSWCFSTNFQLQKNRLFCREFSFTLFHCRPASVKSDNVETGVSASNREIESEGHAPLSCFYCFCAPKKKKNSERGDSVSNVNFRIGSDIRATGRVRGVKDRPVPAPWSFFLLSFSAGKIRGCPRKLTSTAPTGGAFLENRQKCFKNDPALPVPLSGRPGDIYCVFFFFQMSPA
jgi:hypothetical protein